MMPATATLALQVLYTLCLLLPPWPCRYFYGKWYWDNIHNMRSNLGLAEENLCMKQELARLHRQGEGGSIGGTAGPGEGWGAR